MRIRLLLVLGPCSSGCTVAWDVARTTTVEPVHYATNIEHGKICVHAHQAAKKAWQEIEGSKAFGKDYEIGFKDGFADYLQYGGNGEPPSIPPRCYWKEDSIPGRQAGLEWSAGFRHGASVA